MCNHLYRNTDRGPPFFLFLQFPSLRPLRQTDFWGKIYFLPDEKTHGLGIQRESGKIIWLIIFIFPDDFGLRNPVIQKMFQTKLAIFYHSLRQHASLAKTNTPSHEFFIAASNVPSSLFYLWQKADRFVCSDPRPPRAPLRQQAQ